MTIIPILQRGSHRDDDFARFVLGPHLTAPRCLCPDLRDPDKADQLFITSASVEKASGFLAKKFSSSERIAEEAERQIKLGSIKRSAMSREQKNILLFTCEADHLLRNQMCLVFSGISVYFYT